VGSTLLCNTMAQNPRFRVSDTSPLPALLNGISGLVSKSVEVKGMLANDRERTEAMLRRVMLAVCREWYDDDDRMVFDKSRGWIHEISLTEELFPDVKFIVMINDIRAIIASIEKQDRRTAIFKAGPEPTIEGRLQKMLHPKEGMIGSVMSGIKDLLNRKREVHFIKTVDFTANPKFEMERLYEYLEDPYYKKHNYNDVKNVSREPDYLHLYKFPHVGKGKIEHRQPYWDKYLSEELCQKIVKEYEWFYQVFYPDALTELEVEDVDPTG